MKMLKNIRTCFGLKNSALVSYLGCSVDMLNSILCGRRSPNLSQLLAILKLEEALNWNTQLDQLDTANQFLEQERAEANKFLEAAQKKSAKDLQCKKMELATLQSKRQAWLRGLHACAQLLQTDLSAEKRKWVLLRQRHLKQRLKEQSLYKQWVLEREAETIIYLQQRGV